MRKFLAVLMAAFMLMAVLAVLPISAEDAVVKSSKDGSTAADADAIDLVITEILADTKSNEITMASKDAFQYIEIYNRGNTSVDLFDYAIVRGTYNEKSADPWPSKKFDKKVVLDDGSIYQYYVDKSVTGIQTYALDSFICNNNGNNIIEPGEVAIIWFWNQATKDVFGKIGGTTASEHNGTFDTFRKHYKDMGAEIPAGTKIFATFGVDGVGQSFSLNVSNNYMYALVKDDGAGFDVAAELAYKVTPGADSTMNFEANDKVVCMFELGTGLGYYKPTENKSAIYTLASKAPNYVNAYFEKTDADYYASGDVDSYKEMACIYYEEDITPGKLLPIQWADLDPDGAPADVKGSDANWTKTVWDTYVAAVLAKTAGGENVNRPEEDKGQSNIDVDRNDLGNLGQNTLGDWIFFTVVDEATGETTYWRYKAEGGSKDEAVKTDKETYELYLQRMAEQENEGEEGLETWVLIVIIVSAVVVLGGIAVVVIVVLKKKNKNVAADDVAGYVQIIDEDRPEQ